MAIKGYSAFLKAPALLKTSTKLFSIILRTLVGGVNCHRCVLQPQPTGPLYFWITLLINIYSKFSPDTFWSLFLTVFFFFNQDDFFITPLIDPYTNFNLSTITKICVRSVSWGCQIRRLHLYRWVRPIPPTNVPDMTLNCIWWRGSSLGALRNVSYPSIVITPRSSLTRSGITW